MTQIRLVAAPEEGTLPPPETDDIKPPQQELDDAKPPQQELDDAKPPQQELDT